MCTLIANNEFKKEPLSRKQCKRVIRICTKKCKLSTVRLLSNNQQAQSKDLKSS